MWNDADKRQSISMPIAYSHTHTIRSVVFTTSISGREKQKGSSCQVVYMIEGADVASVQHIQISSPLKLYLWGNQQQQ